jgi:nicotinic acid mononucleotide adenylyltransferase
MHWKLARDRYLAPLVARLGEAVAWDSGFFFDADDRDAPLDDVDWLCTPIPQATGPRPVALLATGGFCPIHAGHLAMMERARQAAEAAGHTVIAGYLSPGHDAYVQMKAGPAAIPASERLRACAAAISDAGWLHVDPWEALHRRVAVNYTDVAARLRAYLRAHVDPQVDVYYVCGGDNARFAQAFVDDGGCIVVARPGTDDEFTRRRTRLAGHANLLWCEGDHPGASRAIREPVWRDQSGRRVVMRLEDARAVRTLGIELAPFQRALAALLAEHAEVRVIPLGAPPTGPTISLDAMQPGTHTLAISRCFALGGYQPTGHVARPGWPPLAEQLAAIPPGDYALCDDDAMTGGTLAAVRTRLPAGVRITETRLAITHAPDEDVVDSRDFLLGADDGGLVVELAGGVLGRAPYILPYVDPAARCSLSPERARSFSIAVWRLNEQLFAGTSLRIRDLPAPARNLFPNDLPLAALCRWHLDRLQGRL